MSISIWNSHRRSQWDGPGEVPGTSTLLGSMTPGIIPGVTLPGTGIPGSTISGIGTAGTTVRGTDIGDIILPGIGTLGTGIPGIGDMPGEVLTGATPTGEEATPGITAEEEVRKAIRRIG